MSLQNYFLVEDSEMPSENLSISTLYADSPQECARLCERNNATLSGYDEDGAISTGYSYEHCNGFVYDNETKQCALKNKRMGNFYPQTGPLTPSCAFYNPAAIKKGQNTPCASRYISGYRWNSLINEINDPFPNITSGMKYNVPSPGWSSDDWGKHGNFCNQGSLGCNNNVYCNTNAPDISGGPVFPLCAENEKGPAGYKQVRYDVRPGAVLSPKNTTDGPYVRSNGNIVRHVPYGAVTFPVENMQQCADACSASNYAHKGTNAFTFWPDYTTEGTYSREGTYNRQNWQGTCSIGHVREPYYQTLTPHDNGAISGFALTSMSNENHRFLFGQEYIE